MDTSIALKYKSKCFTRQPSWRWQRAATNYWTEGIFTFVEKSVEEIAYRNGQISLKK